MSASAEVQKVAIPSLAHRAKTVVQTLTTLARDPNRLDQVLLLNQTVNLRMIARAVERLDPRPEVRARQAYRLLADVPVGEALGNAGRRAADTPRLPAG